MGAHTGALLQCLLVALCSKQATLRKRAVQALASFISNETCYTSMLTFVEYRFATAMTPQEVNQESIAELVKSHPALEAALQQPMTVSDFKIALQCLVVLA